MKANELMIGDWVRKLERGGHSIPVKIIAIYEYNADYETRDGNVGCMSIHGYEPIPLTAEILEKNGFKYDEFPKFAVNEITEKTKVTFSYHSGSRTVFMGISEPNFNLTSACVLCVHELQHLLRQSRIEKEIEL